MRAYVVSQFGRIIVAMFWLSLATIAWARQDAPPLSWSLDGKRLSQVPLRQLPAIDRGSLLLEDDAAFRQSKGGDMLRFAEVQPLSLTLSSDGVWDSLSNGARLWRMRLQTPNATDINLTFDHVHLPEGANLHLYAAPGVSERGHKQRYYEGPYVARDIQPHGKFWTPIIPGDEVTIELYLPSSKQTAQLALGSVNAGYRDLFGLEGSPIMKQGSCNIDVVCPLGDSYRNEIRSVARYSINGSGLCTGTLMMDAASSFRPWFLTAAHCNVSSESVADSLVFYWNYQSSTCGALAGGSESQSQLGSKFLARRVDVDMSLVELDANPSAAFNVHYAGWDRSGLAPTGSIHIHHPSGDEKAISFNDDTLTTGNSCIGTGGVNSHWNIDNYEQGTTEPGSSGSGVWTLQPNPRVIGFLSGGAASCSNLTAGDCYGKLSVAWDGPDSTQRLRDYLGGGLATPPMTVNGSDPQDFSLSLSPSTLALCRFNTANVQVTIGAVGGFSGNVSLTANGQPSGVTAQFLPSSPVAPGSSTLTLTASGSATLGAGSMTVSGTSGGRVRSANLALSIESGFPGAANLQTPSNSAGTVDRFPVLTWAAAAGATQYRVQIAADGNFAAPVLDQTVGSTHLAVTTALAANTSYSWRVTSLNGCGTGLTSSTFNFTTGSALCSADTLAIPDNSPAGVSRSFNLGNGSSLISDIDVSAMITHTYVGDISLRLRREASSTDGLLIDRPGVPASANGCSGDNINVVLDDEAASTVESQCAGGATAINGTFRPNNPLSAFDGQALSGNWTLTVSDSVNQDTGTLTRFCFLPTLGGGGRIFLDGFESSAP